MKKINFIFSLLMLLVLLPLSACATETPIPPTPTLIPTLTCTPTAVIPTATATSLPPTITPTPPPLSIQYNPRFLSALPSSVDSCLPDKTTDDIGVYIYDLSKSRELLSINADVPFQFASAFKGPVLIYFLSQCRRYWDTESPEWNEYFSDPESTKDIPYYASPEYKALIAGYFSDSQNWGNIEAFFETNRFKQNGAAGVIDKRYFVLSQVYAMATRSNNPSTGELLKFIFENCKPVTIPPAIAASACYQPNAISAFNVWFNEFTGITYQPGEPQRGLYKWDVVIEKDTSGNSYEAQMATFGLEDKCAVQTARLNCSTETGMSVWTARDLFKFYNAVYYLNDVRMRNLALSLLVVDNEGPARGNMKNLARRMGAASMSKNGHAHFILGSINTDAGIFLYKDTPFIIAVLGYDAQPSLSLLWGDYSPAGEPLTEPSLIRDLLVEYLSAGG